MVDRPRLGGEGSAFEAVEPSKPQAAPEVSGGAGGRGGAELVDRGILAPPKAEDPSLMQSIGSGLKWIGSFLPSRAGNPAPAVSTERQGEQKEFFEKFDAPSEAYQAEFARGLQDAEADGKGQEGEAAAAGAPSPLSSAPGSSPEAARDKTAKMSADEAAATTIQRLERGRQARARLEKEGAAAIEQAVGIYGMGDEMPFAQHLVDQVTDEDFHEIASSADPGDALMGKLADNGFSRGPLEVVGINGRELSEELEGFQGMAKRYLEIEPGASLAQSSKQTLLRAMRLSAESIVNNFSDDALSEAPQYDEP